jgi:hypothetical protein
MRVKEMLNVFAVGDAVAFTGPKFAHMAVRQRRPQPTNLEGGTRRPPAFRSYYHEIATI